MNKRIVLAAIMMLCLISGAHASVELWTGVGVSGGRDYISKGITDAMVSNTELVDNGLYDSGKVSMFSTLGPSYEILFFPFAPVRVGLYGAGSTAMILNDVETSVPRYQKSQNFDMRQDLRTGIAYNQFFGSSTGMFMDIAYEWSWYRIAGSNRKNSRVEPEYSRFLEKNLFADFGCIIESERGYFKFGFAFRKPITNEYNNGWALDLFAGGGFVF